MSKTAALLAVLLLAAVVVAPPAAAQGGVPGGPCMTLCTVLIVLAGLFLSCVTGEVDQTVHGQGDGGWCTEPTQDSLDCWVEDRKRDLGLGPGCTPL